MAERKPPTDGWWGNGPPPWERWPGVSLVIEADWSTAEKRWESRCGLYYFNEERASAPEAFTTEYFTPTRGPLVGKPLRFEDARRVYAAAISPDVTAARALAGRLQRGDLPSPFAVRDVYRPQWSGLTTREAAAAALDVLVDVDWLRPEEVPTRGRPRRVFHINPRVREMQP